MFNCSGPQEDKYSSYWYFQILYIAVINLTICILNIAAVVLSLHPISRSKPIQTWLLVSCYMSGLAGSISAVCNDLSQSYQGILDNECFTPLDHKIPSLAGAQIGVYCLFCLSLLRYFTLKRTALGYNTHSNRLICITNALIWLAAFTSATIAKIATNANVASAIQGTLLTIPLVCSIVINCFLIKKLRRSRVMNEQSIMRRRTERAGKLVTALIIVYIIVLALAPVSRILPRTGLPPKSKIRAGIWLKRLTQSLCFSAEAVAYFWMRIGEECSLPCCYTSEEESNQANEIQIVYNIPRIVVSQAKV